MVVEVQRARATVPRPRGGADDKAPGAGAADPSVRVVDAPVEHRHVELMAADVAMGMGYAAVRVGVRSAVAGWRVLSPAANLGLRLLRPAPLPERYWPENAFRRLAERGQVQRVAGTVAVEHAVFSRVPLVLDAVLDEVDLTQLLLDHVDLNAVAAELDIDAILDRVDLIALARYIIDEVDLPEIIRDSTGSMASEGIRSVRMQTIDADQRVNRLVDRMLLRRHSRETGATEADTGSDAEPSSDDGAST